jgi:hypothetical protein
VRDEPGWTASAAVPASDVARLERELNRSSFEWLVADREALAPSQRSNCYDGAGLVVEAYRRGRYRYVARHVCDAGFRQVRAMAGPFDRLARARTPGLPRGGSC